jgi:soluble lytic murein transglycosylase-like protein
MLHNSPIRVLLAGMVAAWAVAPASARADVLEIGGDGHSWVAGGPRVTAPVTYAASAAPMDGPAAVQASLTEVDVTAGPQDWRGRVAELAAKYDISPALLEAVVWQESRWRTGAVSPVGARGLAQLMPGTARDLGVNPHNPSANLEGGARYLRMQLDAFGGDVEKALAAYNAGPGRVQAAGGIPAIRETREYVAAIMARLSQPVRR